MHAGYHPGDLYDMAREAHMPNLPDDQQKLLAARVSGMSYPEIGERVAMDPRAVRKTVEKIETAVAMACGLQHRDSFLTSLFFCLRGGCEHGCTGAGMRFLQERGEFGGAAS